MQANPAILRAIHHGTRRSLLATAITLILAAAALAQATAPQINVPYKCPNGMTYTFLACKPAGNDQWCTSQWEQNGKVVNSANSYYSAMTGRLQGCTVATANQPAKPGAPATPATAQFPAPGTALNPSYLQEFPSPDQVMAMVKGSSPADTTNRQLGALRDFKQMIQDLAGDRWFKTGLMPDEARLWSAYDLAYNNLAKPLNFPLDGYTGRADFAQQLFATFQMTNVAKLLQAQDAQFAAAQKARQQQQNGPASPPTTGGGTTPSGVTPLQPSNDPTTMAARRCVELGGAMGKCTLDGLSAGLGQFIGFDLSGLNPNVHGLAIFGTYQLPNSTTIAFSDSSVVISGCGKLVAGGHAYTVQPVGTGYAIKITNQPQTLLVGIGADGRLAGPASQAITGSQITGYEVTTKVKTGAVVGKTPIYGPVTETCTIGTVPQGPPQDPTPVSANLDVSIISALGSILTGSSPGSQAPTIPAGPRFVGVYTNGSDFRIQFQDANAVIDCKQAHVMAPYDVVLKGGAASINVKNGATPFTATPAASGALTGPASVVINGKLMTGLTADTQPVLTPTSATCSASSLTLMKTGK